MENTNQSFPFYDRDTIHILKALVYLPSSNLKEALSSGMCYASLGFLGQMGEGVELLSVVTVMGLVDG